MNKINQQKNINIIINDGMTKNVIVTILNFVMCCCSYITFFGFITGLIGIYHSNQVKTKLLMDDQLGAQSSANDANLWGNISIGILLLGFVFYIFIVLFYGFSLFLYDDLYYY